MFLEGESQVEVNGILDRKNRNSLLIITFLSLALLFSCGKDKTVNDADMSIKLINENAPDLLNKKVRTQGVILIYPDLRLFQDESVKYSLGEERLNLSIAINMDFDYEEIRKLECYGKNVSVEGYIGENAATKQFYFGKEVKLINSDGSICHVFLTE